MIEFFNTSMSNTQAGQNIEKIQGTDKILNEIKCQNKLFPKN